MKLIIDIPEDSYKATCDRCMLPPDVENVVQAIRNGTPLPKGHGKLKDADVLKTAFPCGESVRTECVRATIDYTPTIIEADTESNKENDNNDT